MFSKYHECLSYVKCTVTYTNVSSKCKHMCSCIVLMSVFHCCILTIRFAGMGNLLKVLTREIENYPHFFLDFESKSGSGVEQREKEMDGERCWEGGREGNLLGCSLSVSRSVLSWWRCPEGVCSCSAPLHLFFSPPPLSFTRSRPSALSALIWPNNLLMTFNNHEYFSSSLFLFFLSLAETKWGTC